MGYISNMKISMWDSVGINGDFRPLHTRNMRFNNSYRVFQLIMTERGVHTCTCTINTSEFTGVVVGLLFSEKLFQHSGRFYTHEQCREKV